MEQRYDSKERDASGIFLVIDEFAALRIRVRQERNLVKSMTVKKNHFNG